MKILLNGKIKEIDEDLTILDLLNYENIEETMCVEVFLNKNQVKFEDYSKIKLNENDEVEYIFLFSSG